MILYSVVSRRPGYRSRDRDSLYNPRIESPWGPICCVVHPVSSTIGTWSFPVVKRPKRVANHPSPSSSGFWMGWDYDRRFPPRFNWIPPSSGLSRGVRWSEKHVSGLVPETSVSDHLTPWNNTVGGKARVEGKFSSQLHVWVTFYVVSNML
jgi:hypothetical protein